MRLKRAHVESPEINMTPVIDIVFQLMIFFLIATQVKKTETEAELVLPMSRNAQEVQQEEIPLIVNILKPEISKARPYVVMAQTFDLAGFKEFMKSRKRYFDQLHQEMPVLRIRADKDSQFQQIQDCLIACRDVGIWQVRLTTLKGMR